MPAKAKSHSRQGCRHCGKSTRNRGRYCTDCVEDGMPQLDAAAIKVEQKRPRCRTGRLDGLTEQQPRLGMAYLRGLSMRPYMDRKSWGGRYA